MRIGSASTCSDRISGKLASQEKILPIRPATHPPNKNYGRRKNEEPLQRWLFFERKIFFSDAFGSLSKNGFKCLVALFDQRQMVTQRANRSSRASFVCVNSDGINLTYTMLAKKYGIPRRKIPAAIDQIRRAGFAERVSSGGTCKHGKAVYRLSERYLFWKPGSPPCSVREVDPIRRGTKKERSKKHSRRWLSCAAAMEFRGPCRQP